MPRTTTTTKTKTLAAIYCRISDDREGRELGVQRQEEDCRALCEREGFTLTSSGPAEHPGVYVDNDKGASTRTRKSKKRDWFDAMIADAEAGKINTIISYSNSRLTRRPMELEGLIQLHERTGVRFVTIVSGEDDLSTADGRMLARLKAGIDAGEVERTAERLTRWHLQAAQQGRTVGGTRPFGWRRENRFRQVDPVEAALLREAAQLVIDGVPVARIAADWNSRGILTPNGNRWQRGVLKQTLISPRLAGWRMYKRAVATDRIGNPVRGDFEPILDQATHDQVVATLSRPDKRTRVPRRGARQFLLSGVARCGVCLGPMYGSRRPYRSGGKIIEAHYYVCTGRKDDPETHVMSASGRALDRWVCDAVARDLERRKIEKVPVSFDGDERIEEIGRKIKELMAAYRAGKLSSGLVFGQVSELEAERDALGAARHQYEAELREAPKPVVITPVEFLALDDVDRQRAVIENRVGAIMIAPTTKLGNRFDYDRVEIVWR